ncbi:hypothetical protein EG68_04884 [Paragonimus skrjabini miyazakii]|uniref:Zinc transporter ZIP13 n=1 Tax=Paragonimus skrjabini miyazakii TaxID=59628 RepID=A0A8S9YT22_9TREM|nr:hypothetical protein EG68_04884 [Paragonimus skrjabini miyazakii]
MWPIGEVMFQQHPSSVILCIFSAFIVGLSGIIPLLFIPLTSTRGINAKDLRSLNRWLSYATGSLLGEVFIHLLPEAWSNENDFNHRCLSSSYCIVAGLLLFFLIEKLFSNETETKQIEGYLNLFANVIDNFTHGIAIGGSYLVSTRLGVLTTVCILIHEIPHEMGDFVILLRSGFTRWQAIKGQLATASGSLFGAILTLTLTNTLSGWSSSWILPFTAGGFLHISLVSLVPDIMKETSVRESAIHLALILLGIGTMFVLSRTMD